MSAIIHGDAYYCPEDFQPDERSKVFAKEHQLNIELELQAFLAHGFSRPKRWHLEFFYWLSKRRMWNEGERARERARSEVRGGQAPPVVWEPNARHRAFCAKHQLQLAPLAERFIRSGYPAQNCTKDADETFGKKLAKLARGEKDPVLSEAS